MDFRRPLIFCIAVAAASSGCRQNHAARELLERELRLQEDRIYQLEAELEDAHRALTEMRECPDGRGSIRDGSAGTTFVPSVTLPPSSPEKPARPVGPPSHPEFTPPSVELPAPSSTAPGPAPPFPGPPAVVPPNPTVPEGPPGRTAPSSMPGTSPAAPSEPGTGAATPGSTSPPLLKPMSSPRFLSPSAKPKSAFDTAGAPAAPVTKLPSIKPAADTRIKSVTIGRGTRGINLDNQSGDDGVLVVLEARNARGETVSPAAETSLVLIDPAVPGDGGRYARWDFTRDDADALFRPANSEATAGSYFELPWPESPPAHSRLKLFVRMTTDD